MTARTPDKTYAIFFQQHFLEYQKQTFSEALINIPTNKKTSYFFLKKIA